MRIEIYILPDNVCFYNVEWSELDCPCSATGSYANQNGNGHDANAAAKHFIGSMTVLPGFGTRFAAIDHAYSGHPGQKSSYTPGYLRFDIPNRFRVPGGPWKNFAFNIQMCTIHADGTTLTTTKGGAQCRTTTVSTATYTV